MEDFLKETPIMIVESLIILADEIVVLVLVVAVEEVEIPVTTAVNLGTFLANALKPVVAEVREMVVAVVVAVAVVVVVVVVVPAITAERRVIFLENVRRKEILETEEEAVNEVLVLGGIDGVAPVEVQTHVIIAESQAISLGNVRVTKEAPQAVEDAAKEVDRTGKAEEVVVTPAIIAEKLGTSLGNVLPEEKAAMGIINSTVGFLD